MWDGVFGATQSAPFAPTHRQRIYARSARCEAACHVEQPVCIEQAALNFKFGFKCGDSMLPLAGLLPRNEGRSRSLQVCQAILKH